jgi:hypothetical protein
MAVINSKQIIIPRMIHNGKRMLNVVVVVFTFVNPSPTIVPAFLLPNTAVYPPFLFPAGDVEGVIGNCPPVVLAAIKQNSNAFDYASKELKSDISVKWAAKRIF